MAGRRGGRIFDVFWCQCCLLGLPKISTLNGISYLSGFRSLMLKLKWHIRPPTLFTPRPLKLWSIDCSTISRDVHAKEFAWVTTSLSIVNTAQHLDGPKTLLYTKARLYVTHFQVMHIWLCLKVNSLGYMYECILYAAFLHTSKESSDYWFICR